MMRRETPSERGAPPASGSTPGRNGGFTLTETLIALVVIGIVTMVALPVYQGQAMTAKRATARTALQEAASRQEQFMLDNKAYTSAVGSGGLNLSATVDGGHYVLSIDTPTGSCPITRCFVLRATPQGTQAGDACGELTVDVDGEQLPAGCW